MLFVGSENIGVQPNTVYIMKAHSAATTRICFRCFSCTRVFTPYSLFTEKNQLVEPSRHRARCKDRGLLEILVSLSE